MTSVPGSVTLVVVTGTGTEVGKTYVTAAAASALRARGIAVVARKPVQSFSPDDQRTDADVLAAATGEDAHTVCPAHRWFAAPMAPPMAAEALGADPFSIDDLAAEVTTSAPADTIVLVEGAGGVRSPLARDGDSAALVDRLRPAVVVLVADADLGTINQVRLSAGALVHDRIIVFLNRFDERNELHRRNRAWLRDRDRFDVVTDVEELTDRVARRARP